MDDGLGGIVATTNLALSAPDEHALRQAIEKPAQGAGVQLEPGLATQIVADVRDQPGGLPLMQFVLSRPRTAPRIGERHTGGICGIGGRDRCAVPPGVGRVRRARVA